LQQHPAHVAALNNMALLLVQQRNYEAAFELLVRAVRCDFGQKFLWNNLGVVCKLLLRPTEAAEAFEKAIEASEIDLGHIPMLNLLALTVHIDRERQQRHLDRLPHGFQPLAAGSLCTTIRERCESSSMQEVIRAVSAAVKANPTDPLVLNEAGLVALGERLFNAALKSFTQACAFTHNQPSPVNNAAIAYEQLGDLASARSNYEIALRLNSNCQEIWNNLANLYRKEKRYAEALEAYDKCLALKSDFALAHNNKALVYVCMGEAHWQSALACFDSALRLDCTLTCASDNKTKLLEIINKRNKRS